MKMSSGIKFIIQIAFLICGIIVLGCAGNKNAKDTQVALNEVPVNGSEVAVELPAAGNHFLWKVSDENSSVWVLGSIHFADSTFYPLDSVIETAFENAEELAVEINLNDDSTSGEVASRMMQDGVLPKGETLNSVLPRNVWNSLDSLCAAWNFPIMALQRLKPWYAATTLSSVAIQRTGIQPEYGIDVVLMERAASEGKNIVGLETAEEQVDALSGGAEDLSDSAGIYYLKTTLREISELDSMISQMMRAWKTGNDSLLRVVMNEDSDDESETEKKIKDGLEERIYTSRNAKMTESIANFLAEDRNVFVVIGAAHLTLDRDNVIELLKRKGLTVQRY